MKIAVCDDEKIYRDEVINAIENYFGKLEVTCFHCEDGSRLLSAYEKNPDVSAVFLDIEMPELDGMSAAKKLREMGYAGPVIFLTSHTEFAMDGYEVTAFRFLSKPVQAEKMTKTLSDLKALLFEQKKLVIRYEGEDIILTVDDICYVEAMNNSISIVLENGEYIIRKKITDVEAELSELTDTFIRIHRGYLVNLSHVIKHKGSEVYVTGGKILPLSRGMIKPFKEQLLAYVKNSAR